jgi:2-C-methyl-D-erythritol 4-phosphate cytidylyltransferase
MLQWSLRTFEAMSEIAEIIVVTERDWIDEVRAVAPGWRVVRGASTRQGSVYEGLKIVTPRCRNVLVHDGARPLITAQLARSAMQHVREGHAALLAVPVVDTIKIVDPKMSCVAQSLDRSVLWAAQTPQVATAEDLRRAHEAGIRDGIDATDDAMLLERIGVAVHVVPGSPENFKVTLPDDLLRAQHVLEERV